MRRLLAVIAAVAAAGMLVGLSRQYARTYTLARQAARLEQHRSELVAGNERLREEIQRLQTDDRYIERIARQQLGLVRPGEIELLIVTPGGEAPGLRRELVRPGSLGGTAAGPARSAGGATFGAATTAQATPPRQGTGAAPPAPHPAPWRERLGAFMKHLFGWLRR